MKIYGSPGSTCTEKVLFALAEKGQEAESVFVNLARGEHKQPAHLARHPFGVIPVLEDDGFWLYESRAILRYLDERFARPSLTPHGAKARAQMAQWLSVEQSYLSPAAGTIRRNLVYGKFIGISPDPEAIEGAAQAVGRALDVLEKALAEGDYLAGTFSLAEISFTPELESLYGLSQIAHVITERPHVHRWFQSARGRPAWQKLLAAKQEMQAEFARRMQQPASA